MKQYTTPEQTAKLIELGFAEPKSIRYPKNEEEAERVDSIDFLISDYSIGELIEMLPTRIEAEIEDEFDNEYSYLEIHEGWTISYFNGWCRIDKRTSANELIDALYDMAVKLKEEGVI
jgi:hypothetical protein